jgi:hypothetical protein
MVRRRLCSITDVAPVAERACSSTARTPWCSAPSTQRRPSLQLVKVGRRQGSTTDVAHLGWARLLIDRMDTQVWCSAPNTLRRPSPRWARPRPSHRTTRFLWGSRRRRRDVAAASDGGGIARSQYVAHRGLERLLIDLLDESMSQVSRASLNSSTTLTLIASCNTPLTIQTLRTPSTFARTNIKASSCAGTFVN